MKIQTRLFTIIGISVILLVGTITYYTSTSTLLAYSDSKTENAINYLTNVMFVPSVGLDKEAPIAKPNTIWLTNDNILAYAVLSELNNPMAMTLNQSLAEYGVSGNGLVEVLLNKTIEPIRASNCYNITTIGQYSIKVDVRNGSVMEDFNQYADLCFWWSQNLLLSNNTTGAIDYFNQGMSMWNGTGFLDKAFYANPTGFQTFKVGLALWMAERLNWTTHGELHQQTSFTDDDYSKMQNIIWTLQDPTNGGIHTGYTSTFENIRSDTDTNVETTSICLLYQFVPHPTPTPTQTDTTPPPTLPSTTSPPTGTPTPTPTTPELALFSLLLVLIVCACVAVFYKRMHLHSQQGKSKPKNISKSTLP